MLDGADNVKNARPAGFGVPPLPLQVTATLPLGWMVIAEYVQLPPEERVTVPCAMVSVAVAKPTAAPRMTSVRRRRLVVDRVIALPFGCCPQASWPGDKIV